MSKLYSKETIESLIKKLDSKLKRNVEVVAIGGTALSLLGDRPHSKDIDMCYLNCDFPSEFTQAVLDSGKEVGIAVKDIEMFNGFEMSFLNIPNFGERALLYKKLHLKHILFKVMHPVDIILSKIYRGEPKDINDSVSLIDEGKVDASDLNTRFIQIMKYQHPNIRVDFSRRYNLFIKDYFKDKQK